MTKEQELLRENFLKPETRDGVYVSAELKAVWKVLLDILEEIKRICEKYNLEWTLEGGSLLGAIRHRGFIPWDDDIDVVMPRKDYDRLVKVMPRELPAHLFMQTTVTDIGFHIPHIMVRDSRTTGIDPIHAKNHKIFNMGIRVDVLPLDGMPKSNLIRRLVRYYCLVLNYSLPRRTFNWHESTPRGRFHWLFGSAVMFVFRRRGVYWLRELPLRMLPMNQYEWCGSLVGRNFWHPHSIRRTEWFKEYIEVPFEYLMVKVPREYDKILTQQFKNWKVPVKGGAYHGELVFDVNKDWKMTLIEKFEYKESDFK